MSGTESVRNLCSARSAGGAAILFLFGLLATVGGAAAETVRLTVPAGKASHVGGFYIYQRRTCYSGPRADYAISRQAGNGGVSVVKSRREVRMLKRCPGQIANGLEVFYRPRSGFRGEDRFSITFSYDLYEGPGIRTSTRRDYIVTVK